MFLLQPHLCPADVVFRILLVGVLVRYFVFAFVYRCDGDEQFGGIGSLDNPDKRIVAYRTGKFAYCHVAYRIENHHLTLQQFTLFVEPLYGLFHHIAQPCALAAREVAHRVAHILARIAVFLKYRLVDLQRIGVEVFDSDVGVGQKCFVEDVGKRVVGNDAIAPTLYEHRRQYGQCKYSKNSSHRLLFNYYAGGALRDDKRYARKRHKYQYHIGCLQLHGIDIG